MSLKPLTETLSDADRALVFWMDQADHVVCSKSREGMVQPCAGGLRGKSPPPIRAAENPANLQAGPSLGLPKAGAS